MLISQKTRYALRGLFQLAAKAGEKPVKVAELAEAQNIPARFLEVIFAELKQPGIVESRRGNGGGYLLARPAGEITVGEVVRVVQGLTVSEDRIPAGSVFGDYTFELLWNRLAEAIDAVYESTTLADLVHQEMQHQQQYVRNYTI
jgi:Rrf2 family protein